MLNCCNIIVNLPIDGHLYCFQFLVITISDAVNIFCYCLVILICKLVFKRTYSHPLYNSSRYREFTIHFSLNTILPKLLNLKQLNKVVKWCLLEPLIYTFLITSEIISLYICPYFYWIVFLFWKRFVGALLMFLILIFCQLYFPVYVFFF